MFLEAVSVTTLAASALRTRHCLMTRESSIGLSYRLYEDGDERYERLRFLLGGVDEQEANVKLEEQRIEMQVSI